MWWEGRAVHRLAAIAFAVGVLCLTPSAALAADDHGDAASTASPLALGARASGRISPEGDLDWFKLNASAGVDYVAETSSPAPMDTTLRLVDRDGRTVLAFDDDSGGGRASRLAWRAARTGTYYLVVAHYDDQAGTGGYEVLARRASGGTPTPGTLALAIEAPLVYDPKL